MGALISADQSTMTLVFDSYVASMGPGVAVADNRKNCQLTIDILYPGGFQYSILSADYRGYAAIDKGITGTLKSTYYFAGQQAQVSPAHPPPPPPPPAPPPPPPGGRPLVQHGTQLRGPRQRRLPQERQG